MSEVCVSVGGAHVFNVFICSSTVVVAPHVNCSK